MEVKETTAARAGKGAGIEPAYRDTPTLSTQKTASATGSVHCAAAVDSIQNLLVKV
jgi:hypothetical protein